MFCPNYKNKEVFEGFNQIVTALGGQPLTEKEFRSSELRNKRTGVNYSAMETAYKVYHRNGGNFLDLTPNGKKSILFQTLLDHFGGDIESAIIAKSNVYSDEFFNWFGDWTAEEKDNVSKVVDENGEPLVVWHTNSSVNDLGRIKIFDRRLRKGPGKWLYYFSNNKESSNTYFKREHSSIFDKQKTYQDVLDDKEIYYEYAVKVLRTKNGFDDAIDFIEKELDRITGPEDSRHTNYNGLNVNYDYFKKQSDVDQYMAKQYAKMLDYLKVARDFRKSKFNNQKEWNTYPVYLNVRSMVILDANSNNWDDFEYNLREKEGYYAEDYFLEKDQDKDFGGLFIKNYMDTYNAHTDTPIISNTYGVRNSNQIKHVENLGTFNPNDPNMYHVSSEPNSQEYKQQSVVLDEFFGDSINTLQNGGSVSTQNLIQHLLVTGTFAEFNTPLAEILQHHDIQVIFNKLESGKPMAATEYESGKIIIEVDPEQLIYYSQEQAAEYLLHEVVHGVSIHALNNPTTVEEKAFSEATNAVYDTFNKLMPESLWSRDSLESGAYILSDKYEFAAVFTTDDNSRRLLYEVAIKEDKANNNKVFLRLKRFINALSRLLVNKNVFKNVKSDQLKLYEKQINKYLVNRKAIKSDDNVVEYFKKVVAAQKQYYMNNQVIANLQKSLRLKSNNILRHFVSATPDTSTDATQHSHLWATRIKITEALQTRLAAINVSTIDSETKERAKQSAQTQVEQFKNPNISNVVALSSFMQQALPQLLDDLDYIRNIDESSHSMYMYNMHDNFGAYYAIFDILDRDLKNKYHQDELEEEFKTLSKIDKLSATKDVEDMMIIVKKASGAAHDGMNYMYNILMNNLRRDLSTLGEEINFSNTKSMLDSLEVIGFDTNSFINSFGSKDGAKDPIIRAIVYLVNKAIRKSQEQTIKVATDLLDLNSRLAPGESALDLYELDGEGKTTQYLVRELNFGKFYKDYKNFIEDLNEKLGLDRSNRRSPDDVELRRKWNLEKNKWLGEHAHRRFVSEYYEAYAELSDITLQRLQAIRDSISQLKQKAYDENDKFYHYERLTADEWKRLQGLYISKRVLGSDYTINGDLKIEGTDDYVVAKEIQKLNSILYSDETQIKRATEEWANARNAFIKYATKKCTGDGGIVNTVQLKKLINAWDARNSKRVFKKEDDKLAIFKMIDEQVERITGLKKPVYDYKGDGGATYEENQKRINETIGLFRDYNTGEPIYEFVTGKAKANIKQLEKQNKQIREYCEQDKAFKKNARAWRKAYKNVFDKYLKSVYTSYYRQQGGFSHLSDSELSKIRKPKWATKLELKNVTIEGQSIEELYTELLPGDGWINRDENTSLLNPEFKPEMGVPYIPKRELYDNSIQYNKIMSSPTLKALYDGVVKYMTESNDRLFNRMYSDNYQLPGMTGSMWKYMKAHGATGSVAAAIQYTKDHLGFTESGLRQDDSFGSSLKEALAQVTDLQEIVYDNSPFATKTTGTRPDGRQFNIIPQYYTNKLDDPSQVSSDLIGMVCEYYQKACDFENKSEIRDYVESMVDAIEKRRYQIPTNDGQSAQIIPGQNSKSLKAAKKFVEMNLYNIRSDTKKVGSLNLGKTAQNFSRLTQALNLGMSPAVALTGFFTAQYAHLINAITGDRGYGMNEWTQASGEVINHYIRTYGGVGMASNQMSDDKLVLLAEHFNVANQLARKFRNANRSRLVRLLDNWCFGGLTVVDFASKSTIMTTILMSHRYFRGKFLSKEDILNMLESSTEEGKNRLLSEWKEGKVLYSIFNVKNGKLEIDQQYKEAYDVSKNMVYQRINKTAESADGMATETQKAAITTNFFGAAVLTHRQYLPLMIQARFLPMVYDFDMQMYTQGQYIIGAQFFSNVVLEAAKQLFRTLSIQDAINVFNDRYNEFTHDTSSEENWKISRARKKALKKTATELIVFNTIVVPLVSLICMFADDDDKKDWLALQLAAYIARRTQWETFTPYRFDDMLNNIKSVSAQTGTLDKMDAFKNMISRRIFPQGSLFDTMLGLSNNKKVEELIQRGVYKNHSRTFKTLMQLTPYHNLYEQWYGAKAKRMYYEKQIMKLDS